MAFCLKIARGFRQGNPRSPIYSPYVQNVCQLWLARKSVNVT